MDKKQTPAMLLKIKSMRENLSKAELLVCDYIIEHPEEVIYLSVSELAAKSGVSDATVIRASQKIGSSSYQDLKISLAQDIVTPLQSVNEEIEAGDPTNVVVEKVFQGILHTLNYTYRLQDGGMLGLNATAYSDNHLQVICSSFLKKGDVLFAVSHSGSSRDVVHAAEIALEGGAAVISLTNVGRSPLADISTIALHTASNETRYRRVALSSRIAQMAIVDVLYTMIALKKPDTADGFFKIEK